MGQNSTFVENWGISKLSEVIGIVKGTKPHNLDLDNSRYSIPYINIQAFEKRIFSQYTDGKDARICNADDILLVWDGARCGLVGKGVSGAIGSTLAKLEIRQLISPFVFYFLQSQYETINKSPRGIGIPHIDPNVFWNIEIPIPPLPEQERIVAKIEELFTQLDAGVAGLKRAQAALKRYRASVLKAACEGRLVPQDPSDEPAVELLRRLGKSPLAGDDLTSIPEGWCWTMVGDVADHRLGKMLDKEKNKGELRAYIRNINVRWFEFDLSDIQSMRVMDIELENVSVRKNDLVVCEGGEPGRAAVWNRDEQMIIQKALHRVRPVKGVLPVYLVFCLATDAYTGRLEKYFTGSTIKHFTGESLHSYIFPLPPLREQQRIVADVERRLSVAGEVEAVMKASLNRSMRLRQAILKLAFEGRL